MQQRILIADVENKPSICFDTGLDPRSFARTKMSQSLIEPGYIVNPDGSHEVWKPAGVYDNNGSMRVFGQLFQGKRLDLLLEQVDSTIGNISEAAQQTALQAVTCWIRAKMFLGETRSALNPGAAFVTCDDKADNPKGSVFFAPENLSNRCLFIEGSQMDRYNCPDLAGMDIAAFCAGVMLYKILTGSHPYPTPEIYQDMREGNFLPAHLAAPALNEKLSSLIQSALLLPVANKRTTKNGTDILSGILEILMDKANTETAVQPLFINLPAEKKELREKEKKLFLFKQNVTVKTRRFAANHKYLLIGASVGFFFLLFVVLSTAKGFSQRLTTEGMTPEQVVSAYYDAFSSLNHMFMEACIQGADRTDINVAATFYAIVKQRQAYEMTNAPSIIQAKVWKATGGELPAPNVFGVTDLDVEFAGGSEDNGLVVYRTNYLLWSPDENYARNRSDVLTLKRDKRKNWRIVELLRSEK
ncbi:MAG: hypothetical protein LBI28_08250 [Treponema sp.]|jgi:hypothetical protein|nr:hypothetical protein [Treponema sp.]